MEAKIKWIDKVKFKGESETGHNLLMDGPAESGGENQGMRPMELMLLGIGGCTSYDVVSILKNLGKQCAGVKHIFLQKEQNPSLKFLLKFILDL